MNFAYAVKMVSNPTRANFPSINKQLVHQSDKDNECTNETKLRLCRESLKIFVKRKVERRRSTKLPRTNQRVK